MKTRHAGILPFVIVGALTLSGSSSHSAAPQTMSFQGVLATSAGAPQPDGEYTITFRLYDAPADGNLLWTEPDKVVTVAGGRGVFSTLLGDPTPFGLVFDQPYYVEIEVAGEGAPMTPRLPLAAVPYALNASTGAATLTLPFSGSVDDPGSALTIQNTSGSGVRSITNSGRAIWATCTGASYGAFIENSGNGIGVNVLANAGIGVAANSVSNIGVYGKGGTASFGVYADASNGGSALRGVSVSGRALWATCSGASYGAFIENTGTGIGANVLANAGIGIAANSVANYGVLGRSQNSHGVYGVADNTGIGVYGVSNGYDGVQGLSASSIHAGVAGINASTGFGVYGRSNGGGYAGYFDGRVRVTVLEIAGGADLAERFETNEQAEPGTVMCIDSKNAGHLAIAAGAYNRKVAGVISGANKLSAGMVLSDPAAPVEGLPLAMTGRVWVKCDTANGPIEPGDMLTTSETKGHAMKVTDFARSQGATIGKAMTALESGDGLVLALVSLQ